MQTRRGRRAGTGARALATGLLAILVAAAGQAQEAREERLCQSMARHLERLEASPRTRPETLGRARQQFRQRCEGAAPSPAAPAAAEAPAPPSSASRPRTPGRFADWNGAIDEQCREWADSNAAGRRTRCAQLKIDRALDEGRLDRAEVEACMEADAAAATLPARSTGARQRERMASRMESLGGAAYWAWDAHGGCRLAQRVRATFSDPDPSQAPRTVAQGGTVSEAEARARLCETDPRLPFCAGTAAPPGGREQPYWRWQSQAYSRCVAQAAAGAARDQCARNVVERALAEGRAAPAAVDACRSRWQGGARSEPEMMAVEQCLLALALLEQAASSRVAEAASAGAAPAGPPGLSLQGLSRADLVAPLYAGDLAKVPAGAEDLRYMLTSFGRLNESCPNLGLAGTAMQIAQAQVRQTQEAAMRGLSGRGSVADAMTVLGAANEMMKTLPACERIPIAPPRREACMAERDSAFQVQIAPAAVADATRLIERHGCGSAQMTRYAEQLSTWLLAPAGSRGSLAGLDTHPQAPALARLCDHCRRQAGNGVADAWCGCYVRNFANSPRGTRSASAEVLDAAAHSAFIGGPQAWYAPPDIEECEQYRPAIERWRRDQAVGRPVVTACLVQQQPAEVVLARDVKLCRYRGAAGVIELRAAQCPARLHAHEWGSEAVACAGVAGAR